MRTAPFIDALTAASVLWSGKTSPDAQTKAQLNLFLNRRAVQFWEQFPWPEWTVIEERLFAPRFNAGESLASPSVRYYAPADAYYQSLLPVAAVPDVPVDDDGVLNSAQWALVPNCDSLPEWDVEDSYALADQVTHPTSQRSFQARATITPISVDYFTVDYAVPETLDLGDMLPGDVNPEGGVFAAGDRVLRFGTSGTAYAGVYTIQSSGPAMRSTDANTLAELVATPYVFVASGSTYAATWFQIVTDGDLDLGVAITAATSPGNNVEPGETEGWETYWGEIFPFYRVIALDQDDERLIGECFKVYSSDPRCSCDGRPPELKKEIIAEGILIPGGPNVVWLRFRLRAPSWTGEVHSLETTYALDEQAWDSEEGDYFKSLAAGNVNHAVTDTAWWERIKFPYALRDAASQAAYADMLRMDGQQDKFIAESAEAFRLLRREFDKLERQQGQTRPLPVRTRC